MAINQIVAGECGVRASLPGMEGFCHAVLIKMPVISWDNWEKWIFLRSGMANNMADSGNRSFVPERKWISVSIVQKEPGYGHKKSGSDLIPLVLNNLFLHFFHTPRIAATSCFAV
jgi:hypothetical protein